MPPLDLQELCNKTRLYYQRGWIPATAGNFSLRSPESSQEFWITSSGLPKESIQVDDFLCVSVENGDVLYSQPTQKPSAETSIHRTIYSLFPQANCILHTHNPDSLKIQPKLTRFYPFGLWQLPKIEMLKAFGIWEEEPEVFLPVFFNFQNVHEIADAIQEYLPQIMKKQTILPALLVENHGPTVWGENLHKAHIHLEALDYCFRVSSYYGI